MGGGPDPEFIILKALGSKPPQWIRFFAESMLKEKQRGPSIKSQAMLIIEELAEKVFTDDTEKKTSVR